MFSRIREALRIITYRAPENGPDAVIVERDNTSPSAAGHRVARLIEATIGVYTIGKLAAFIGDRLIKVIPDKQFTSTTVLAGCVAALLLVIFSWIRQDLEEKFRAHLHLADTLAPYFGKRLENASRVLRGSARAS